MGPKLLTAKRSSSRSSPTTTASLGREAEVLPYLARGRSAKVIAEALFVSESTIRTHTRRILEKTCLHSKQELIDLVEKY